MNMMMNRHTSRARSRAREMESRQPQEDGRQWPAPANNSTSNAPRSPRPTSSAAIATTPPPPPLGTPVTPHSAPPPSSFPKTRCYRLNLERPFDIQSQKSPLGRDYSGPPVNDSDLPPAQGPVEYLPPPHLCSREELAWRRHSWGGGYNGGGGGDSTYTGTTTVPSELLENLHVSISEESNAAADPTSIAISTARIFRGIVVDRNGVITSMNPRAMRSQRGKGDAKNMMGEKSRQAAKIDKAKDLIDEVVENGGVGSVMSDVENDPTKIVSLYVMGEYEDLNDLVRDGSKKLRDSKTLTDEDIQRYNRPRQFPLQSMTGSHISRGMVLSPNSSHYNTGAGESTMNPACQSAVSNIRKRVFSTEKPRAIYHKVLGSAPKIKSSPRDTRAGGSNGRGGRMSASHGSVNSGYHQQHSGAFGCNPLGSPLAACDANRQQQPQQQAHPNYFQQQCNFFPGKSDWTEVLGFSVNSIWNCGANGDLTPTMSPHSNPSSPRGGAGSPLQHQQHHGAHDQGGHYGNNTPTTTGGGVYHGSGATSPTVAGYHGSSASGYGGSHNHHYNNNNGGSNVYNVTSPYRDEGRNPSYGYGRGSGVGVRDTVVM